MHPTAILINLLKLFQTLKLFKKCWAKEIHIITQTECIKNLFQKVSIKVRWNKIYSSPTIQIWITLINKLKSEKILTASLSLKLIYLNRKSINMWINHLNSQVLIHLHSLSYHHSNNNYYTNNIILLKLLLIYLKRGQILLTSNHYFTILFID